MPRAIMVGPAASIAEGQARVFGCEAEGVDAFFLVRLGGKLSAWRNDCPHQPGTPLPWRRHGYLNAAGTHITCHAHGAVFDANGVCIAGPCPCPGATLAALTVRLDDAGNVWVEPTTILNLLE